MMGSPKRSSTTLEIGTNAPMSAWLSVYLDGIRFVAALIVYLGHVGVARMGAGPTWMFAPFGQLAVLVFFVLSGLVIGYSVQSRKMSARQYTSARGTRLASVVVPTVCITAILDAVGSRLDPELYRAVDHLLGSGIVSIPACLTFLNEAWGANIHLGSDDSYWSMGYEVPYYALFGVWCFSRGRTRVLACVLLAIAVGPSIMALFPTWLLGVAVWYLIRGYRPSPVTGAVMCLGSLFGAILLTVWVAANLDYLTTANSLASHNREQMIVDYLMSGLFGLHIWGFSGFGARLPFDPGVFGAVVRWLAGGSFTLYLLHLPLVLFVRACLPNGIPNLTYYTAIVCLPFVAAYAIAEFTERRKAVWRDAVERAIDIVERILVRVRTRSFRVFA